MNNNININDMVLINTEADKTLAALGSALRAISPASAAIIMAVAARAAWEMADTDQAVSAAEEAELLAISLMRASPLQNTRRAVQVLGEPAERACDYAHGEIT